MSNKRLLDVVGYQGLNLKSSTTTNVITCIDIHLNIYKEHLNRVILTWAKGELVNTHTGGLKQISIDS